MTVVTFTPKAKKANGIIGIVIDDWLLSIEDKNDRHNWYRKMLQTDYAIFFSQGTDGGEVAVILDVKPEMLSSKTELTFCENGRNGKYIIPISLFQAYYFNQLVIAKRNELMQ